jgi:hypothetical protein
MNIEEDCKKEQIKSLRIESDNSAAVFNLNRGAAATALMRLTDRVLEMAETMNIQIVARHIPGKYN